MQIFFVYLLKVIIYSGILFGYYHIALRNKRFHYYNRFYLLMSVALSLGLPFLQLQLWQWKSSNLQVINLANIIVTNNAEPESEGLFSSITFNDFILLAYIIIAVCLLLSFVSGLLKLVKMKKQYPAEKIGDVLFINTDLQQAPFSFFKNLFWKNTIDISCETGRQIFRHELTHIEQKHSSDKLFLQIVALMFWLNPFYWLIQKELGLIHEFIADEKAIDNKDAEAFAMMLLQSQFGKNTFLPVQSFYYSPIKRRLRMLTSSSKTSHSYARRILALPVLSLTILLFAFRLSNDDQQSSSSRVNAPFVLVVDAGHGGSDDGAVGLADATEKGFNLSIAKKIAQLAPGYGITVKMTRKSDETVSLQDRMEIIKKEKPDAFVSIHVDVADAQSVNNDEFHVFITKDNTGANYNQSRLLGSSLIQSIKTNLPVGASIVQRSQKIYVLDQNPYPAVIVECGYMTNEKNLQQLSTDAGVEKIAKDILEGVVAYANNKQQTTSLSTADTTGKQPLYILDGKEITADEMKKLDANKIESVNVLKEKEAVKAYGEKGRNGAVIIIMNKQNASADNTGSHTTMEASSGEIQFTGGQEHKEFIYVNGREMSREDLNKIPPADIKVISVWKGEEAIKKYGEAGKNGVIDVKTNAGNEQSPVYFSKATDASEKSDTTTDPIAFSPSFPGGNKAWITYLQNNIRSDVPAKHGAPTGTYMAVVQFRVDENGNISDLKAVQDPGFGTGAEAVRVIQRGPKWIPAQQDGKPVTAMAKQSVTFHIEEGH